jgi:hypothetical protein
MHRPSSKIGEAWLQFEGNSGTHSLLRRRVPFDEAAGLGINDFCPFACLCGGAGRPLSFGKLVCSYQPPAVYPNLKGAAYIVTCGVFPAFHKFAPALLN